MPVCIQPLALRNLPRGFSFGSWSSENHTHRLQSVLRICGAGIIAGVLGSIMPLQFFAGFEANRFPGRDGDFFTSARVAAYATLARLNDKDSETAQFDALAARQCLLHRMKKGVHRLFGFHLWYAGALGYAIDDV